MPNAFNSRYIPYVVICKTIQIVLHQANMWICMLLAVGFVCSWYCVIFSHNTCTLYHNISYLCVDKVCVDFIFMLWFLACRNLFHVVHILFLFYFFISSKSSGKWQCIHLLTILNTWKLCLVAVFLFTKELMQR